MKTRSSLTPQVAFWGICVIAFCWIAATLLFEMHLGLPGSGIQWAKRIVGWGVEIWLLRTLLLGVRRRQQISSLK